MRGTTTLSLLILASLPSSLTGDSRKSVTLEIDPSGFGASRADIHAVCRSAGDQLLKHLREQEKITIVVSKGKHGPITLFQRNEEGAHLVKLDTGQTFWSQYAYQFAHEICHVLCRCENDYPGNLWFEETLCELASLYCLREMSKSWRQNPPYPNWKDYAHSLRDYSDEILRKRAGYLEILHHGLPAYYRKHAETLRKNPTDREKNGSMAIALLALFERDPTRWDSIRWLNSSPSSKGESFTRYLTKWRNAVPDRHHDFVESIATLYGIVLDESPTPPHE